MSPAQREEIVQGALAQAEELRRAGRHEEGISLLLDALRYGVHRAQILFRLGNLYFERGDLARAEHAYRRATEEAPYYASAHHNLGVVYRRQGKISQSVRLLKKARWLEVRYPQTGESPRHPEAIRPWARAGILLLLFGLVVLVLWLAGRS